MARLKQDFYNGMWEPLIPIIIRLHKKRMWPSAIVKEMKRLNCIEEIPNRGHGLENYRKIPTRMQVSYIIYKEGRQPYKRYKRKAKK